jgi:hypothetical protein
MGIGTAMTRYILLTILISMVFGCTSTNGTDAEKRIIGTWQEVNNPKGALIFKSDHNGQAYWPDENGAQQASDMKWELIENGAKVSVITPPGPVIFEIKDNRLIAPNGVVLTRLR